MIFARDLALDTSPADLKRAFGKFGRITVAVIVKGSWNSRFHFLMHHIRTDKESGLCKGSAFIKFADSKIAQSCLTSAGESRTGPPLEVNGRPCRVSLAVDRESASKLRNDEKLHVDRRHVYLLMEGQVLPSGTGKSNVDHAPR